MANGRLNTVGENKIGHERTPEKKKRNQKMAGLDNTLILLIQWIK